MARTRVLRRGGGGRARNTSGVPVNRLSWFSEFIDFARQSGIESFFPLSGATLSPYPHEKIFDVQRFSQKFAYAERHRRGARGEIVFRGQQNYR